MKKIVCLFIAFIFIFSSISYAETSNEQELDMDNYVNILLCPENFKLPNPVGKWSVQPVDKKMIDPLTTTYLKNSDANDGPATADIYIPEDGTYVIWGYALNINSTAGTSGKDRWNKIGFDGTYDKHQFTGNVYNKWTWSRSESEYVLAKGWHTVNIGTGHPSSSFALAFITNNLDLQLPSLDDAALVDKYKDIEGPVFDNDITVEYLDLTTSIIKFPIATDDSEVSKLVYYVDSNEVVPDENGIFTLENLHPLQKFSVSVTAKDCMGNETTLSCDGYSSSFALSDFSFYKTEDETDIKILEMSELSNLESVKAKISYYNKNDFDTQILVVAAIYTKDFKRMVAMNSTPGYAYKTPDEQFISVDLLVPEKVRANPSDYVICAEFLDSMNNIEPLAEGVLMENDEVYNEE